MSNNTESAEPNTAVSAEAAPKFDLAKFDSLTEAQEQGITVQIMAPDGSDTGIVITVAGPDSDRQRKAKQKEIDERLRRRSNKPATSAEMDESGIRMLASSIVGWNNIVVAGNDIPFTVDAAVSLFQRFPWIREQVDQAAGDRAGFLKS